MPKRLLNCLKALCSICWSFLYQFRRLYLDNFYLLYIFFWIFLLKLVFIWTAACLYCAEEMSISLDKWRNLFISWRQFVWRPSGVQHDSSIVRRLNYTCDTFVLAWLSKPNNVALIFTHFVYVRWIESMEYFIIICWLTMRLLHLATWV